uniref:Uncharacterized LOC100186665 n=1 Tax=Ciona intestinalis TaxID=7719 RepID=F6QDA8_CIOIN|nr:uncharacterized protein LOC100186665 [Ciona intestinalis]|eukprot:XP_002121677.1 uncharacterized protein LOC100186665 [Ciona intestinalis]
MSISCSCCLWLVILVLFLSLECCKSQEEECKGIQKNYYQNAYYYYYYYYNYESLRKICYSTFRPLNNNMTNYAVLMVLMHYYCGRSATTEGMVLPDGKPMTENVFHPRCFLYISPYSNCSNLGKHDCEIKKSKDWPPRINVTSHNIRIRLTYLIIECQSYVTTTHALTTTIASTIRTTDTASDVTETTVSSVQSDQLSSIHKLKNTNNILLGLVIGFGVLLLLLVAYIVKLKRIENKVDSKPLENKSKMVAVAAVNEDGNAVYEFANALPSGHAEMIDNELYQSHGGGI